MIIICGTQRCGTTLLASYFIKEGFDLGTRFFHGDINGGYENPDICMFYRKILKKPDFPFADFIKNIEKRKYLHIKELDKYNIIKFSFLLMNPIFVDILYKYRSNKDKLLILFRPAEEVIESKTKNIVRIQRFALDCDYLKQDPIELKLNWYDSFTKVLRYGFDYQILLFPQFINDYFKIISILNKWGVNLNPNVELWNKHIDINKITSSKIGFLK